VNIAPAENFCQLLSIMPIASAWSFPEDVMRWNSENTSESQISAVGFPVKLWNPKLRRLTNNRPSNNSVQNQGMPPMQSRSVNSSCVRWPRKNETEPGCNYNMLQPKPVRSYNSHLLQQLWAEFQPSLQLSYTYTCRVRSSNYSLENSVVDINKQVNGAMDRLSRIK